MKKTLMVLMLLLSGCAMSYKEIEQSKAACAAQGGYHSLGSTSDGTIVVTYCDIGGVRYTYMAKSQTFVNGRKIPNRY